MLDSKLLWVLLRFFVVFLWCVLIYLGFIIPSSLSLLMHVAIVLLLLIHLTELPIAFRIGKEKGLTKSIVVIKTMVYGFTWWVPLRRGVINE